MTANSRAYTIPIWDLVVAAIPYSGPGQIAQENFDGSITQRIDGWTLAVSFQMNLHAEDNPLIGSLVDDIIEGGDVLVDFDPVDYPDIKTGTFVMTNAEDVIKAAFAGHVRNRPVRLELGGVTVLDAIPNWFADASPVYELSDPTDLILLKPSTIEADGSDVLTLWPDSSGNGLDLTTADFQAPKVQIEDGKGKTVYTQHEYVAFGASRLDFHTGEFINDTFATARTGVSRLFMLVKTGAAEYSDLLQASNGGVNNFGINQNGPDQILVTVDGDNLTGTTVIADSEWHLVEVRFDVPNTTIELFIDGAQDAIDETSSMTGLWGSGNDFILSIFTAYNEASVHVYPASIAMVKWMEGVPSAERIEAIRNYAANVWGVTIA